MSARVFEEVVRLQRAGEPAALATIIGVAGSSPAKEPMKMVVRADGSCVGSVGGGCFEDDIRKSALDVIRDERAVRRTYRLTEDESPGAGLVCGGEVEVYIEPITAPSLVVFGGGHVSKAVVELAAKVGFRVVVTDDRAEYARADRFPAAIETWSLPLAEAAARLIVGPQTYVLVMTRDHRLDREVLRLLSERQLEPRYLGMIGSKSKVAAAFAALRESGVAESFLRSVRAPVGLSINAKLADEIAVAIVAELIAVRRGVAHPAPEPRP
ncbi:MAG: XdhC/CoxI family protein [Planctomycetota bacterium]